jgi:hypothetical protein
MTLHFEIRLIPFLDSVAIYGADGAGPAAEHCEWIAAYVSHCVTQDLKATSGSGSLWVVCVTLLGDLKTII